MFVTASLCISELPVHLCIKFAKKIVQTKQNFDAVVVERRQPEATHIPTVLVFSNWRSLDGIYLCTIIADRS